MEVLLYSQLEESGRREEWHFQGEYSPNLDSIQDRRTKTHTCEEKNDLLTGTVTDARLKGEQPRPNIRTGKDRVLRTGTPRSGNAADFRRIYQLQCRDIYSLFFRMIGNTAVAETLTEKAFLEYFRQINTHHYDAVPVVLLYRLATDAVLGRLRNSKPGDDTRLRLASNSTDHLRPAAESLRAGSTGFVDKSRLALATIALPVDLRIVFVLHDVLQRGHSDIADVLEISPETSKARLHKARLQLRELLCGGSEAPVANESGIGVARKSM
jgi:RNA polymerase sigma-70 factor, ECF subfamily